MIQGEKILSNQKLCRNPLSVQIERLQLKGNAKSQEKMTSNVLQFLLSLQCSIIGNKFQCVSQIEELIHSSVFQ